MDACERLFFALLRTGLWERYDAELDKLLPASEPIWRGAVDIAHKQGVTGLVFKGASMLPTSLTPPAGVAFGLLADIDFIEKRSRKVLEVAEGLLQELPGSVLMKGPSVARLYLSPELRESGDIDLYLPPGLFERCREMGKTSADGSVSFDRSGVLVELHPSYYDIHCRCSDLPLPGSPEGEMLMLSSHILKHSLGVGVGLKQFCDMARAYATLPFDPDKFHEACRISGTLKWNAVLARYLVDLLGLPESFCRPAPKLSGKLFEIVMSGGLFGQRGPDSGPNGGGESIGRKMHTASAFMKHFPWAVSIAPRTAFLEFLSLIKGNL